MKHFYESIPGMFDFQDIYTSAVNRAQDGARFLEIGNFMGKSLAFLAVEIVNSRKRIELYSVDHCELVNIPAEETNPPEVEARERYQGQLLQNVLHVNLFDALQAGLFWEHRLRDSVMAAPEFPDESLDFIFLDTIHNYAITLAEIVAWYPKLKPGGRFAGHDHTPDFPGVEQACRQMWGDDYYVVKSSFLKVKPR